MTQAKKALRNSIQFVLQNIIKIIIPTYVYLGLINNLYIHLKKSPQKSM